MPMRLLLVLVSVLGTAACGKSKVEKGGDEDVYDLRNVARQIRIEPQRVKTERHVGADGVEKDLVEYEYDGDGRVLKQKSKKGAKTFVYESGRVSKETQADETGKTKSVKTYTYDAEGRVASWSRWDGVETAVTQQKITRDAKGLIVDVVTEDSVGGVQERRYDRAGRTVATKRLVNGEIVDETSSEYIFFVDGLDEVTPLVLVGERMQTKASLTEIAAECTFESDAEAFSCSEVTQVDGKQTRKVTKKTTIVTTERPLETRTEANDLSYEATDFNPETGKRVTTTTITNEFNAAWLLKRSETVEESADGSKLSFGIETDYDDVGINAREIRYLQGGAVESKKALTYY